MFGPYIDGKSGKWEQDTLKQRIGNVRLNDNLVVINNEIGIQPEEFVRISNLVVPKDDSINAYAIKRVVPATHRCPERPKADTIRVYQQSSEAKVLNEDTVYLCKSEIDTFFLRANQPVIGKGFWQLIRQSNPSSIIDYFQVDDTTLRIIIPPDSCIYQFRWSTFISTFCKDTVIGSKKDIYIVTTKPLPDKAAEITQIGGNPKQDTNWLCQKTTTELTNKMYTAGKGNWRVISGRNSLSVTFNPVPSAPNTKVNVSGLSLPSSIKNDTSKYLIEFSIVNSICDTSRDTINIFILRNASLAQLAPMPINPQYLCSDSASVILNPPHDSTVIIPVIGKGEWTKKDSLPGTGPNLGVDTIKWTWTVSNRCFSSSVQRIYIIANNKQGDAIIRNKPFSDLNKDTLVICLATNKDTPILFNGNKPLAGGSGRWSYFLNGPLHFTPSINDSSVKVNGFSGNDSVRVYGLIWSIFKSNFCPPTYDTAYVKVFRRPAKPLFDRAPAICIPSNIIKGKDSMIFYISPSNIGSYTFGKFEWSIIRGDSSATTPKDSPYIYILRPTGSQRKVTIVLKNAKALTDSFSYIIRLKVSGGGTCEPDSNDYKMTIYPAITNKKAFGYINDKLPDPGSKIIRVCEDNPDDTRVYLSNKTLKPYQKGTWKIITRPNGKAVFYENIYPEHVKDTTSIYKMSFLPGQTMAQYTTEFTITNKNVNNANCSLKDTVIIYLISPGDTANAGILEKSDSFCYGTTGERIELTNPVGAASLDWERKSVDSSTFITFIPNTLNLTYDLPEIIKEYDYRVKVRFLFHGEMPPADIGTCPTKKTDSAWSNPITISLKNKDTYRLGTIDPKHQEICAESPMSLTITSDSLPSELEGHTINKWQTYHTNAYGTGAILPENNPWIDQPITDLEYKQIAPQTAQTIFYRAWINHIDVDGCPFVTDTATIYIKPKPKMSGIPFPLCADNDFKFRFDSTTEGGYENKTLYPHPFTSSIQGITWKLANASLDDSRTGMTQKDGILSGFSQAITYKGTNNDTIPLMDTVIAYATGVMGCPSDSQTITFKVYPKAKAELINSSPLVNCPPINIDTFFKLREYKTLNSGYTWIVKDASNTWTSNGILPPKIETNYGQNLAIELMASSLYKDSLSGTPCPSDILKDTLFSFGRIIPNITISDNTCYRDSIAFTNNSSVSTMASLNDTLMYKWWDNKDSLISTDIIPSAPFIPKNIYPYKDSFYAIKYEISNRCYSISETKDIHIQSIPKANLKVNEDSFCSGTIINIWKDNELGNNPNSYENKWIFGDGKSFSTTSYPFVADSINPIKHQYNSISYAVDTLLQIISNNCASDTQRHLIKILPRPKPAINLTIEDTICGSLNKYPILNKTFFGGKEPVSASWYINGSLIQQTDSIYAKTDTLLHDTLWHSFAEYVNKDFPDEVKPISIKLSVTPSLGCEADSIAYILVGSTAQPEIFIDTIQPCPPATFNIRVTAAPGINTWKWSRNDKAIDVGNTPVILSIPFYDGDHKIKVVVESARGICPIDSAIKTITVYGYPQSAFEIVNPGPYCYSPFPASYESKSKDANVKMMPITDWYWRIDSNAISANYPKAIDEKDFIYTYPLGGEYTTKHWVRDTRGTFHCYSDTITRNYTIQGRSMSCFSMSDTICATHTVSLDNNSTFGYGSTLIDSSYWIMGDGTEIPMAGAEPIKYSYKTGGKYDISLLTKGNLGVCIFDTLTKTIVVRGFPTPNFDMISPCSGNYTTFNNLSTAGFADQIQGYTWKFQDGQISNYTNPSKLYDVPGEYFAKLTVEGNLCPLKSDTTKTFLINPAPKPIIFPIIYVGENIPFDLIAPSDNNSYVWLDKNKNPLDANDPNAQIITTYLPGLMTDTFFLRSTSEYCIVDNIQVVKALPKLDVIAPSGFTPNNDGINDFFKPNYIGVKELKYFQIFDRFGQLMFSTSDMHQSWDGTFGGKSLPTATYIWVVSCINDNGEPINASGGITLIREKE
ncbi:MAG: T9SS type B sorting domain-containing protein [Chitinophagaceae bacterium]